MLLIICFSTEKRNFNLLIYQDAAGKDQTDNRKKIRFVAGPWGGSGGASWDDGVYSGVREIILVYDTCIDSIRVVYDKHGKLVAGEKHGGVGGNKMAEVLLLSFIRLAL